MHFIVYELGLNASWKVLRVSPPAGVLVAYWTLRGERKSRWIDRVERTAIKVIVVTCVECVCLGRCLRIGLVGGLWAVA